jgi:hypothetical protein
MGRRWERDRVSDVSDAATKTTELERPGFPTSAIVGTTVEMTTTTTTKRRTATTTALDYSMTNGPIYKPQGWTRPWLDSSHGSLFCGAVAHHQGQS